MPFDTNASGVYVIAATPFHSDGRIDHDSADRLTDFYLEAGASGLTVLGVMGEAPKLDADESVALVRRVVRRAGKTPVVVGVTSPGFAPMRALARNAMEAGAAGVMIAPPATLRSDDQVVSYFAQAREAIGEDAGNGGIFVDFELERGADGAMTGYAFPDMLTELVALSAAGERDRAHDLFDAHLPLLRYEQQPGVGLAVRKYLLHKRGVIASQAQRKPATALSEAARAEVDYLLARLARRDGRACLA
ncbi:MAG: dihydrodipicolinate synthase family protein [Betaproteobacteria bacterium]|nr:dihydrodipicolinate synthase family protein [Betaproteobacteria bacterium]